MGRTRTAVFHAAIDLGQRVYYRLIGNGIELPLRFIAPDSGVREMKDAMSRQILFELEAAGSARDDNGAGRSS